jgi:ABC-2 type transport system ATP-binding protein
MSEAATTEQAQAIIEAASLVKVFRDFWHRPKVQAVRGITFDVRPGEVFGLLGPNGSGKSTTLKMVLGLLYPTRGSLRVLGRSPRDVKTKARVGYLPEESYLYPYLTLEETLDFYGRLFDLTAAQRRQRIDQLLEMIGLRHARRRPVGEVSKGMARRIAIAQSLINDPDLIVLDEPTSGLDPLGCRQVKDLILTLARRGKTVLLSSHLLADVEDVCSRIAILYNGTIQAMGPIGQLLEKPDLYRVTIGALPPERMKQVLSGLREVLGSEPALEHPRRDLEQFFLDVVEKARRQAATDSGVTTEGRVADYLARPDDKLRQLAAPQADPQDLPSAQPAPAPDADERLRSLVQPPAEKADDRHA